ncbi:M23 family metallopeptidase [Streptomyces sp. NPDC004539]|uniref:M23 family metallopeptidase n=1 Tax=Streptomyces sp. NPDC004539 TaxID=3154280 RepID=UPI0033B1AE8B
MPKLYLPFRGTFAVTQPFKARVHPGVDYSLTMRTPVLASADGTVVTSEELPHGYGRYIVIEHADGVFTLYGHLDKRLVGVRAVVRAGQRIGQSGNSGDSTAPHLHFEVRKVHNAREAAVDPQPLLKGAPPAVLPPAPLTAA